MLVQAMTPRMPLPHPHVRQRVDVELASQPPPKPGRVAEMLIDVETPGTRIRQGPEPVQPMRSTEPTHPTPSPPRSFLRRPLRVTRLTSRHEQPRARTLHPSK